VNWVDDTKTIVFWAGGLEFASASQTDAGGRSVRFRMDMIAESERKFRNPFSRTTPGARFSVSLATDDREVPMFEAQLATWNDGPAGMFVKIALNAAGGSESDDLWGLFLGATRPTKGAPGTQWAAAFVLLGEDERPVCQKREPVSDTSAPADNKSVINTPSLHGQLLSNQAAIMLKNLNFQRFIISKVVNVDLISPVPLGGRPAAEAADAALKLLCGIKSKRDLDTNSEAAEEFKSLRRDFTTML
jgi:hypothetical protein